MLADRQTDRMIKLILAVHLENVSEICPHRFSFTLSWRHTNKLHMQSVACSQRPLYPRPPTAMLSK